MGPVVLVCEPMHEDSPVSVSRAVSEHLHDVCAGTTRVDCAAVLRFDQCINHLALVQDLDCPTSRLDTAPNPAKRLLRDPDVLAGDREHCVQDVVCEGVPVDRWILCIRDGDLKMRGIG